MSQSLVLLSQGELTYFETSRGNLMVISISNIYVALLMHFYSISEEGIREIKELGSLRHNTSFEQVSVVDEDDILQPGNN